MNLIFFGFLLAVLTSVHCANILMVYESARRSHQLWIEPLAKALIKNGHNLTMGGCFSKLVYDSDNLSFHPIRFEGVFLKHIRYNKTKYLTSTPLQKLYLNYKYNYAICKTTYNSNGFKTLWDYPKNFTFDIIIMDLTFGPCLFPLIQRFGKPFTVGFTPSALTPYLSDMFGNGGYPSSVVSPLLGIPTDDASFLRRVHNYLFTGLEIFYKRIWERRGLANLAATLLNETFSFEDLEKSISILFINEISLLNEARPLPPNIIPIGGMHLKPPGAMTGVLHSIVNNANEGIIFFTLGTDIQQNIFNRKTKEVFASAFKRLDEKTVIWNKKLTSEDFRFLARASNILIHKWIPQNDLLGHQHIKLLITAGGTLSIQEAIFHGAPVIGIPIYDEHHRNIKFITDNKLGLKLDYLNLTEDNIFETINELLHNEIYKQNMAKLGKKFRDQPLSPLDKAVYWVEYLLKYKDTNGADFLTPKSKDMCSFLASSLDVELFVFTATLVVLVLVFMAFRSLYMFCFNSNKCTTIYQSTKLKKN